MKTFNLGKNTISEKGPCYVIVEIGNNHQGELETALEMIKVAAQCGAQAVKFQKRDNKSLYTKAFYDKPYDNENSYGATYGEHREHLEFGRSDYLELKECAEKNEVDFLVTAFDFNSVDFLEDIGIEGYKIASGDVTTTPLLERIAKLGKPMFVSTGAATLDEVRKAYDTILAYNDKLCLMHCTAEYPSQYNHLNLSTIKQFIEEFPKAVIGYSGHDNGILAPVIAYMQGATVVEKHFTFNRSWKGTDHKFSLVPEGLRKQIRDLHRVDESLGEGNKILQDFEKEARMKMGKGIYLARHLSADTVIGPDDICFKTPSNGTPPYMVDKIVGKKLKAELDVDSPISLDNVY